MYVLMYLSTPAVTRPGLVAHYSVQQHSSEAKPFRGSNRFLDRRPIFRSWCLAGHTACEVWHNPTRIRCADKEMRELALKLCRNNMGCATLQRVGALKCGME